MRVLTLIECDVSLLTRRYTDTDNTELCLLNPSANAVTTTDQLRDYFLRVSVQSHHKTVFSVQESKYKLNYNYSVMCGGLVNAIPITVIFLPC